MTQVSFLTPGIPYRYCWSMANNRRRQARKQPSPREEQMIVFATTGEPRVERKMRINRSRLRLRTSLRRMAPAQDR